MFDFFKKHFFLQNSASWFLTRIPVLVEHNVSKYRAIKKAFYLTALEQLEGDYFEFGLFSGGSFVCAARMHRHLRSFGKIKTKFYGFDSFSGFGKVAGYDDHPFYSFIDNTFKLDAERVIRNIMKKTRGLDVEIVKGYFENTLRGKTALDRGATKARIVFIDCDLKEPAELALEFVKPALQQGTILIMDDFFSYKGAPNLGVAGAYNEFSRKNPGIEWRKLYDYGYGGVAYIISGLTGVNEKHNAKKRGF